MNRELRLALLLLLAGSGLLLLAAGRTWVDVVLPAVPPLPDVPATLTGSDVVPALRGLALLGLAGVAALAATRGRGRIAVGALLLLAGAAALVATVRAVADGAEGALRDDPPSGADVPAGLPGLEPWWAVAVVGGLLVLLSGLLVAARGARWAALSARYDTPAARAERAAARPARPEVEAWDALDRGEDPTTAEPDATGQGPGSGSGTPRLGS